MRDKYLDTITSLLTNYIKGISNIQSKIDKETFINYLKKEGFLTFINLLEYADSDCNSELENMINFIEYKLYFIKDAIELNDDYPILNQLYFTLIEIKEELIPQIT